MATVEVAPAYAPEDPTLPNPWTGLIDGSTGVLYYWNPETNATQYEKPAALLPPLAMGPVPAFTPKLAPIPIAQSQLPNDTVPKHELDQQMPRQEPLHQMPTHQTHHMVNQPSKHYPYTRMNQLTPPQFPKTNELLVLQYQGQQQYVLPIANHRPQQNGFPKERDLRRQAGEPAGSTAPSVQQIAGASGDFQFPGPTSHIPHAGDCSVCPEQHIGRVPSSATGGTFSGLQQEGRGAIHRQQPVGGPAVTSQMGGARSGPLMGQKMGYNDNQHGRGRNEDYSSSGKEGPMMLQQQPQLGSIPHAGNQQGIRMGTVSQSVASGHSSGLDMGQKIPMPKFHDHTAFANTALRGPSQNVFAPTDFTNIPSADSYCQHHEIAVMGDNIPAPFMTFDATGFAPEILREMRYLLERRAYVVGCAAIHPSTQQLICP